MSVAKTEFSPNDFTKRFGDLIVTMRVFDIKTSNEIRCRTFNYNDLELRKWYGKVIIWALTNGCAIELVKADAE
jgi:hypothetical protein